MRRLLSYLRTRFSLPSHRGVRFVAQAAWAPDLMLARRAAVQSSPSPLTHREASTNRRNLTWWPMLRRLRQHLS
ncbi:hypothetical protein [Hymenobacter negativus]|uniref:Uncharacterized protein n=1 Tax=Hymenobacter negativus TaxID=2795026 RepID=A0ABS3QJA3_9BACT|nr:hypothetical protein [Hymenobacter negativus]MBO2011330.1 hypothetical protein [Hymenobacter negativus]